MSISELYIVVAGQNVEISLKIVTMIVTETYPEYICQGKNNIQNVPCRL